MRAAADAARDRGAALAFGSMALPLGAIGMPISVYLAPFYADRLGLPLAALAMSMLLARLVDVAVDPLVGALSDRCSTRIGRRKPWLIAGAPVAMLGLVLLVNPSADVGVAYFLGSLVLLYVGMSMIQVPHRAWGAELSPSYDGRTRVAGMRQYFASAGLLLSTLVPAFVIARTGGDIAPVLPTLAIVVLIALPLATAACVLIVPDRRAADAPPAFPPWPSVVRALRRNGPLRVLLAVIFIGFVAESLRQSLTVFFARDVIGANNVGLIYTAYFASALCGIPAWLGICRRIGKARALASALVLSTASGFVVATLGQGDVAAFAALFVIKGFCLGAIDLLPGAMLADATDVDRAISRQARSGTVFAIAGIVAALGQGVGPALGLGLLDALGYPASGATAGDISAFRWLYGLGPTVPLLVAIVVLRRYSLTAERQARLRRRCEARQLRAAASTSAR